jgi:hypothetical protein
MLDRQRYAALADRFKETEVVFFREERWFKGIKQRWRNLMTNQERVDLLKQGTLSHSSRRICMKSSAVLAKEKLSNCSSVTPLLIIASTNEFCALGP